MVVVDTEHPLHALVATRLCHDVIGPVGAIGNGMELIEALGPAAAADDLALVVESAQVARARIEFLRLAFGRPVAGAGLSVEALIASIAPAFDRPRLTLRFDVQESGGATRAPRCVALAVMCASKALPLGGEIVVSDAGQGFSVSGTGPNCGLSAHLTSVLNGTGERVSDPAEVEFALLREAMVSQNRQLSVTQSEGALTIHVAG
ncbi:MAG: histidine phosphotransferase family protein [Pseudomonadota bacterium]